MIIDLKKHAMADMNPQLVKQLTCSLIAAGANQGQSVCTTGVKSLVQIVPDRSSPGGGEDIRFRGFPRLLSRGLR